MIFDTKILHTATEPPSRRAFYRQAVFIGMGIFAVLAVFQPFGTYVFEHDMKYLLLAGYGVLVPLTAFVLRESIALFWGGFFALGRWTFRRELILSGLFLLLSVILSYFYHHLAIGGRLSATGFVSFVLFAVATAFPPMVLFLGWRFFEVKNQVAVREFSEKLAQTPAAAQTLPEPFLVLQGENKNEKLTLLRTEILYFRAADNYVEVFLQKNGQTQRLMLRGALGNIAQQLEKAGAFRQVHRSFVVNFDHTLRLDGKSPAYFLVFENAPEAGEIPVSRTTLADVRAILSAKPR